MEDAFPGNGRMACASERLQWLKRGTLSQQKRRALTTQGSSAYSLPPQSGYRNSIPGHDVWSLMVVLSEVVEWKLVDGTFRDTNELLRKKLQRKEVVDVNWKGDGTAKIMQHGFGFLEKDRSTLENLSRKDIKRFFDTLCHLFEAS
jgi:hypothetical protein